MQLANASDKDQRTPVEVFSNYRETPIQHLRVHDAKKNNDNNRKKAL